MKILDPLDDLNLDAAAKTQVAARVQALLDQFNIHAQRTWNCINPLEGGQAVLHRRQA
jgi:hypothetical protein